MTVSASDNRIEYAGNGSTTAFSYSFYFQQDADLVVYIRNNTTGVETLQTITTNYTISGTKTNGVYLNGATITMVTAPASGETLVIYGDPAVTQGTDYVENDPLPAETTEQTLDRAFLILRRQNDVLDRTMKLSNAFPDSFDPTLPSLLSAGKTIKVNSAATGFEEGPDATDIANAAPNATAAAASAAAAAASAASLGAAFVQDVVYIDNTDSPVTIAQSDNGKLYVIDSSAGAVAITLPTISGISLPFNVGFKLDTIGNDVTISRGGTDTIESGTSYIISGQNEYAKFIADDTNAPDEWEVIPFKPANRVVVSKTTTYTARVYDDLILADASSAAFTITLPTAVGIKGKILEVQKTDSDFTNAVTLDGNGSETIAGSTTTTLNTQYETLKIISDGTNWQILERRIPGEFTSFTPTGSWSTNTTYTGYWRRVGDSLEMNVKVATAGAPTSAALSVNLPSGMVIDQTKLMQSGDVTRSAVLSGGYINDNGSGSFRAYATQNDSVSLLLRTDSGGVNATSPMTWASGDDLTLVAKVPIVGWNG